MEKRKKTEKANWISPAQWGGGIHVDMAKQVSITRQSIKSEPEQFSEERITEIAELQQKVESLQAQIVKNHELFMQYVKSAKQEKERLYQMVLLLKKEWELERDAHRHC